VTTLVHLSDLHFGRDVDLDQINVLESLVPALGPTAIVISGDLTQRGRHGEFQRALAFVERLRPAAPVHLIPGNHDVAWWETPFGLLGSRRLTVKYRRYFGPDLSPTLELPGVLIASALTSHGVAFGSMTWKFWRDPAVKGHLPRAEVARVAARFESAGARLRVIVLHHNVLRGQISRRMGLAHWRWAEAALRSTGADLVLCGHDHQEGAAASGRMVVATASTHTHRTRGRRPSAFNVITADEDSIVVRHHTWDRARGTFKPGEPARFPRTRER
jgi:3',5'-cyclic AMP phosphodiesterase CpdA